MSLQPVLLDSIISHLEGIPIDEKTYFSAIYHIENTSAQAVSYRVNKIFLVYTLGVLPVNEEGKKIFEIKLPNEGDIISTIDCSSKCKLIVGLKSYDVSNRVVLCASIYSSKKLEIIIDKDIERIYVSWTITVLNKDLRDQINNTTLLVCDNIEYSDGYAI
jgi:hypothetical protein